MERIVKSTKEKALRINLDETIYGTIAEIGGGQETARAFFQAGGASGTIAKSISAYDKTFSDSIYCKNQKTGRYVSEDRLLKMLEMEYNELLSLLGNEKQEKVRYFAFANTVETLNFYKNNEANGWMGMRYQILPAGQPNEVVLHVRLLENDGVLQQYTLGILGVNLIFACFYHYRSPVDFINSLLDNLSTDRIEITFLRMTGPDLAFIDNRLLSVQLVKNGITPAVFFDRKGNVRNPGDLFYRKNILALRGSFRPVTYVGIDMLKSAYRLFKTEPAYDKDKTLTLCEITLNNLLEEGIFDETDFLQRVDLLNAIGQNVMVSHFREFYKLAAYFARYRIENIRLIIGVPTFSKVIDPSYYQHLKGGILEAFGRLFMDNLKVYLYPAIGKDKKSLFRSADLPMQEDIKFLYQYLIQNNRIVDIHDFNAGFLHINSHKVLEMIRKRNNEWEKWVPVFVADMIKSRQLFGYKEEKGTKKSPQRKCH